MKFNLIIYLERLFNVNVRTENVILHDTLIKDKSDRWSANFMIGMKDR